MENNPLTHTDPSGHFAIAAGALLFIPGVNVVAAVAIGVAVVGVGVYVGVQASKAKTSSKEGIVYGRKDKDGGGTSDKQRVTSDIKQGRRSMIGLILKPNMNLRNLVERSQEKIWIFLNKKRLTKKVERKIYKINEIR